MKRGICLAVGLLVVICSLGCAGGDRRGRYQEQFDAAQWTAEKWKPVMEQAPGALSCLSGSCQPMPGWFRDPTA